MNSHVCICTEDDVGLCFRETPGYWICRLWRYWGRQNQFPTEPLELRVSCNRLSAHLARWNAGRSRSRSVVKELTANNIRHGQNSWGNGSTIPTVFTRYLLAYGNHFLQETTYPSRRDCAINSVKSQRRPRSRTLPVFESLSGVHSGASFKEGPARVSLSLATRMMPSSSKRW